MLRLILLRHAKTEPAGPGQDDRDRALEAQGERDAAQMGQRLDRRRLKPGSILSSPAVRTMATATIVAQELGMDADLIQPDERLYLATPGDLMQVVHQRGGAAMHLMVVGHNPGVSEFADRLSADREVDNLPTCAVYTLEFEITAWADLEWASGVNAELDYPARSG